jgi:hypothetical protein
LYKKLHVKIQDQLKPGKYKNPKANLKGSNWITEVSDQRKQQKKNKTRYASQVATPIYVKIKKNTTLTR